MRLLHIRSLTTRLSLLSAGLFAAVMLSVSVLLFAMVERIARIEVEQQLVASGAVYDRLWQQRSHQMQDAARLMARDFGFRAAVATGDQATAVSALDNLQRRLNADIAVVVGIDGSVQGAVSPGARTDIAALWTSLDASRLSGVAWIDGHAKQIVAAPILTPVLTGWVLFASDIDAREMHSLETLSAIRLHAGVIVKQDGRWNRVAGAFALTEAAASGQIDASLARHHGVDLTLSGERSIALAKALPTIGDSAPAALLLFYPRSQAMAAYRPVQWAVALLGLLGIAIVVVASWRAARRITLPLSRLDAAAGRLAAGDHDEVVVEGDDELARLATSFNHMAHEIEERERRITHLAFNDVLTGLANRTMFQQQVDYQLRTRTGAKDALALFCLDLDRFKTVNDTLGHSIGDALLIEVGRRLKRVAEGCFVARLGGDEFVVVQPLSGGRGEIDRLAMAILGVIGEPFDVDGNHILPGTSIGIAIAPDDGGDVDTLLRNADLALYRAKGEGRGAYSFFEESLNEKAQARRVIESDLRAAIERGEFELHFQPLFDLKLNRIGSFEALIRWNHPKRGLVSPLEFIPIAEDTGMIVPIGAWVMREACRQAVAWPEHVRVAVNVSPVQFHRPGLNQVILNALAGSGLAPNRLEIEITESIFLEGSDATLKALHSLRSLGIRIALDDFGTGYSSLSYLQSFPFDKLKIDQSFIQALLVRPGASAVIRAITDLATALGMETTAEGVEETMQLRELEMHGCSSIQGFLFSKPVRVSEIAALLSQPAAPAAAKGHRAA
ncbi:MAG: EAL domain-containing protein [Sphingomonas bacterium]|nr:EAL domain-containing protein [Sphingomonas bacterium]